jgi:hypothetical protein
MIVCFLPGRGALLDVRFRGFQLAAKLRFLQLVQFAAILAEWCLTTQGGCGFSQGSVPFWPSVLSQLTGYSESGSPPFASAIAHAGRLCSKLYTSVDSSLAPNLPAPGGPGLGEL